MGPVTVFPRPSSLHPSPSGALQLRALRGQHRATHPHVLSEILWGKGWGKRGRAIFLEKVACPLLCPLLSFYTYKTQNSTRSIPIPSVGREVFMAISTDIDGKNIIFFYPQADHLGYINLF